MLWVKVCSCPLKFSLTAAWGKVSKAGFSLSQMMSLASFFGQYPVVTDIRAATETWGLPLFLVRDVRIEDCIKSYAKRENNRSPPYIFLGHPLHNPLLFTQNQIHLQMHLVVVFKYIMSSLKFFMFFVVQLLYNFRLKVVEFLNFMTEFML